MPRILCALSLLACSSLLACPKPAPTAEPTPGPVIDAGPVDHEPAPTDDGTAETDPNTPPPAGECSSDADCSGGVCEGQGCGDDQLGTCVSVDRMCTRDSRPYCGCDGQSFRSSGSCPGRRYAHTGECTAQP